MEYILSNIKKWEENFNKYCKLEEECIINFNKMNEIKNNLKKLLGNQRKDDIDFYKSIIDNSYYYLNNSIKIRKTKFLKDLNNILIQIDNFKQMDELNKSNFMSLMKDYERMAENIKYDEDNNTILRWVKKDMIKSLDKIENELNDTISYHLKIMISFNSYTIIETDFYCYDNMTDSNEIITDDNMSESQFSFSKKITKSTRNSITTIDNTLIGGKQIYNKEFDI